MLIQGVPEDGNRAYLVPVDRYSMSTQSIEQAQQMAAAAGRIASALNGTEDEAAVARFPKVMLDECVRLWQAHGENRRTLVYMSTVADAAAQVEAFQAAGVDAVLVHGGMRASERRRIIRDTYHGRGARVVVNVNVFLEGINARAISCIVLMRNIGSELVLRQILGRAMRLFGDKVDCRLLDMTGSTSKWTSMLDEMKPRRKPGAGDGIGPVLPPLPKIVPEIGHGQGELAAETIMPGVVPGTIIVQPDVPLPPQVVTTIEGPAIARNRAAAKMLGIEMVCSNPTEETQLRRKYLAIYGGVRERLIDIVKDDWYYGRASRARVAARLCEPDVDCDGWLTVNAEMMLQKIRQGGVVAGVAGGMPRILLESAFKALDMIKLPVPVESVQVSYDLSRLVVIGSMSAVEEEMVANLIIRALLKIDLCVGEDRRSWRGRGFSEAFVNGTRLTGSVSPLVGNEGPLSGELGGQFRVQSVKIIK